MSPDVNGTPETGARRASGPRTATVNLPFVTAQFRRPQLPHVRTPSRAELTRALRTVRSVLPSTKQVVYFGGLALAAAFEVIEWPVAAAIGVGTALAGREEGGRRGEGERREGAERTEQGAGGRKQATSTAKQAGSA
jgi:hypothetical protein